MTEQEWQTSTVPKDILEWLAGHWRRRLTRWCRITASPSLCRKFRLFAGACCVRSTQGLTISQWDDELRNLVALGKGEIEAEEFEAFLNSDRRASVSPETWALWRAESAGKHRAIKVVRDAAITRAAETGGEAGLDWPQVMTEWDKERRAQCECLRDIFGSLPFRPVDFDPAWRTLTVQQLVEAICAEEAFDHLPILADALEDAGCTNADILSHCRSGTEHVRGCWCVDLVTGRE